MEKTISLKTAIARANRKLAREGQTIKKTRGVDAWHIVDVNFNRVEYELTLEGLENELQGLKILAPGEKIAA